MPSDFPERRVKLFRNGRNQAVRIPREFELPGADAVMRKEGERLVIEPSPRASLLALLGTLAPLDEDFSPISDPPPQRHRVLTRYLLDTKHTILSRSRSTATSPIASAQSVKRRFA